MRLIVIGGGCWGTLHCRALLAARRRGRVAFEAITVVDRNPRHAVLETLGHEPDLALVTSDWGEFLAARMPTLADEDMIVPAPIAPHLFLHWLAGELAAARPETRWELAPVTTPLGTPFESVGKAGERFLSYAEWMCPPRCTEPARCPAIRAPRTWEMPDAVRDYAAPLGEVAVFHARQYAGGVATLPVAELRAPRARFIASEGQEFYVGTVSACHGVLGRIRCAVEA